MLPGEWRNRLVNDFEASVFQAFPEIAEIKEMLYREGALYASMTGSGSAVYGVFSNRPAIPGNKLWKTFLVELK
jgi:4-diphosphocytidyl-2-C-methyl-D-erythritol kinase